MQDEWIRIILRGLHRNHINSQHILHVPRFIEKVIQEDKHEDLPAPWRYFDEQEVPVEEDFRRPPFASSAEGSRRFRETPMFLTCRYLMRHPHSRLLNVILIGFRCRQMVLQSQHNILRPAFSGFGVQQLSKDTFKRSPVKTLRRLELVAPVT
uniref:Uncharacterized protein n=1 Tax=Mesocestoides corti TaxID=53468 RepID=A0A5K3EZD9_MESCO